MPDGPSADEQLEHGTQGPAVPPVLGDDGPRRRDVVLSMLALCTLGLGQPLLDLLGRNAYFLVAHDVGRWDAIGLAIGLTIVLPLALAAVLLIIRRASRTAGRVAHLAATAVLVAVLVLVMVTLADVDGRAPGWLWLLGAGLLGLGAAWAYRRSPRVRTALSAAALIAPAAAGMFLFASPAAALVVDGRSVAPDVTSTTRLPPIVFVMFDELPLASLLESETQLDREMYPSLARLADDGSFYTNMTTVHPTTVDAVPAALSGRYSDPRALPIASSHPTNLLALLEDVYRVRAVEPLTDLCPTTGCHPRTTVVPRGISSGSLLQDLGVLGLYLVIPTDLTDGLPSIDQSWSGFSSALDDAAPDVEAVALPDVGEGERRDEPLTPEEKRQAVRGRRQPARLADHPREFRAFVRGIRPSSRPAVHFIHSIFPHRPWRYLADGRRHGGGSEPALGSGEVWTRRPWPVAQAYQLHLVQTQLADRLIGDMVRRLRSRHMYDDALIVVTADHGASFTPGERLRSLSPATYGEIGYVPLFMKLPGAREGDVNTEPMQSVDILPTLLDHLGVESEVDFDGRSLAGTPATQLRQRTVVDVDGQRSSFPVDNAALEAAVERKLALFGPGADSRDYYDLAPAGTHGLLGASTAEVDSENLDMTVKLPAASSYQAVQTSSGAIPALVTGSLHGTIPQQPPVIAVAVNGTVAAVTRADLGTDDIGQFRALTPPWLWREGGNEVAVFLVGPDLQLQRLRATS